MSTCPLCDHENQPDAFLGTLGSKTHWRCRNCGAGFEADAPGPPASQGDGDHDDTDLDMEQCHVCGVDLVINDPGTNPVYWEQGQGMGVRPIDDSPVHYLCDDCLADTENGEDPADSIPDPEIY